MIRFIAVAGFAILIASSAKGMSPAPLPQSNDDMITQVALACGPGRTRINGVCVARTTVRQTRRAVRRCARWRGGVSPCTGERQRTVLSHFLTRKRRFSFACVTLHVWLIVSPSGRPATGGSGCYVKLIVPYIPAHQHRTRYRAGRGSKTWRDGHHSSCDSLGGLCLPQRCKRSTPRQAKSNHVRVRPAEGPRAPGYLRSNQKGASPRALAKVVEPTSPSLSVDTQGRRLRRRCTPGTTMRSLRSATNCWRQS